MTSNSQLNSFVTGLDVAGPLFDRRRYLLFFKPKLPNMLTREMATKTIVIISNPQKYGSKATGKVGVEIHLNAHNKYKQVGAGFFLPGVHNHAFPSMLASGMGTKASCISNNGKSVNVFYDDIEDGVYDLIINNCWPYCCP